MAVTDTLKCSPNMYLNDPHYSNNQKWIHGLSLHILELKSVSRCHQQRENLDKQRQFFRWENFYLHIPISFSVFSEGIVGDNGINTPRHYFLLEIGLKTSHNCIFFSFYTVDYYYYYLICMACFEIHVPLHTCGRQKVLLKSQVFPYTFMWHPKIELGHQACATGILLAHIWIP